MAQLCARPQNNAFSIHESALKKNICFASMDNELKEFRSEPPAADDGSAAKDDRPLLNPETDAITQSELLEMEQKFTAYVRRDVYGSMGRGQLPVKEKVLLGFAMVSLLPLRVLLATTVLVVYYLICRFCTALKAPNRVEGEDEQEDYAHMGGWRRSVIIITGRFLSRAMLFVFGFYWISETRRDVQVNEAKSSSQNADSEEHEEDERRRPGAIISNHVSYIDILYHMSNSFPSFVAKKSVAKLPLVGLISKCLGCVYVQRESKSLDFKGVSAVCLCIITGMRYSCGGLAVVTERIKVAHHVKDAPLMMLFPEGTTTNGAYLLPFKTGAFLSKAPVLPVILRYPYERFSPSWDSISGGHHLLLLLCQFINHIEVTRLPLYCPSKQEVDDPKLYASNVRRLMATEGNLTLSDIGLAEKRIYHAALNGRLPSVLHQKEE